MAGLQSIGLCEAQDTPGPRFRYAIGMVLKQLADFHIHIRLLHAADILEEHGLSSAVPVDVDGRVSLPYALCVACSAVSSEVLMYGNPNDFYTITDDLSGRTGVSLCLAWDVIEWEVDNDIVEWSESVGVVETVRTLRHLARVIDLPKIHVTA